MKNTTRTGIDVYPGRQQPFTVWIRGEAVRFEADKSLAETTLKAEIERLHSLTKPSTRTLFDSHSIALDA